MTTATDAQTLVCMGYVQDVDFEVNSRPGVEEEIVWLSETIPDPTLAEIDAARPACTRGLLSDEIDAQVPTVTLTDEARDGTAKAKIAQVVDQAKAAHVRLSETADADLGAFDPTLGSSSEQAYAQSMALQEGRNLVVHDSLTAAGGRGIFSAAEVSEIQGRITWNQDVAEGRRTGTKTPPSGAPRGYVTLEGEAADRAFFAEATLEWSGTTYYLPQCTMPPFPEGVDHTQVFGMIYDGDNVYKSWVPFEEQPNGTWQSRVSTSDIASAETTSSRWRMAVAYGHTSAEYEVTDRVFIVPPQTADSIVRFGGRVNGAAAGAGVRRGRR